MIENLSEKKKKRSVNMVVEDIKFFQRIKKQRLVEYTKINLEC